MIAEILGRISVGMMAGTGISEEEETTVLFTAMISTLVLVAGDSDERLSKDPFIIDNLASVLCQLTVKSQQVVALSLTKETYCK